MLRVLQQFILITILAVFASQSHAMFIQSDWLNPTEPGVGTNRYAYSFNDPVNLMDPTGNYAERGAPDDGNRPNTSPASKSASDVANQNGVDPGDHDMVGTVHDSTIGELTGISGFIDAINSAINGDPKGVAQGAAGVVAGKAKLAKKALKALISRQKQAGHVPGTPQHANRLKQNKPTSSFFGEKSADRLTKDAFQKGNPVPGRPGVSEHDFGVSVGTGPNGGMQTRVRVHQDKKGRIHGHPSGPENF